MLKKILAVLFLGLLLIPCWVLADTVKGRIMYISHKASSIQINVQGMPPAVIKFDKDTQFVNSKGVKELGTKDLIEVEHLAGKPATKITKVVFTLPPGVETTTDELEAILNEDQPYLLVDVRPVKHFGSSHIRTAISIFAKDLEKQIDRLPKDKSQLIVFYCGGPTCPYTAMAVETALKHGYTNVKGYQGGMPTWKKAGKPFHASADWLTNNLDEHHVIIDVRPISESSESHIKTAVAMPAADFKALTKTFIKEKKIARLPGVSDMRAPLILYANEDVGKDVMTAFKELRKWQYKNIAILEGGFNSWAKQDFPVATGQAAQQIIYTRKLKKGAIPQAEFAKFETIRDNVILLDVRTPREIDKGTLEGKGALAIPLDKLDANLDKLSKDETIVTYCSNGIRAEMAYESLKNKGYDNVKFLNETLAIKSDGSYTFE